VRRRSPRIRRTRSNREAGANVLLFTFWGKSDAFRSTADIEVAVDVLFHSLPLEKAWFRTPLAAHQADGLSLSDLAFWIDAGTSAVTETISDGLRQMAHELVVVVEAILFDADDGAVIRTEQEIAA
jgi:hypothetical protein